MLGSSFFLGFAYATIGYLVVYIIYQIWFHPLSGYPGPKLAAITIWYKGYYDLVVGGGMLEHIEALHKRYGPAVRIGPNEIHFLGARAFHQIYSTGSQYPKESFFYRCFNLNGTSFGETNHEAAKARRDMLMPLFSRRAILKLERVVQEQVDLLVSKLAKYNGKPADLFLAFRCASLDIISSYSFSYSFDALKAPGFASPLILSFAKAIPYFWYLKYFPFLHSFSSFMAKQFGDSEFTIGNTIIQNRIATQVDFFLENEAALDNAEHEIVYHHLIRPQSPKIYQNPLSRKQLIDEGQVLLGAGSDTISNVLNRGVFEILKNKEVLGKLLVELREAWPDKDQPMSYMALEKLPYLTAVIKESLRLLGGVVSPLPRVVTSDAHIGGYFVPEGTIVAAGNTFLHYDPTVFPDPCTFNPERWLQADVKLLENHFVPFSRGSRMCLGINLAWCELYLLFANIIRKLDMKVYETDISDFQYKEIFVPVFTGRHFHATVRERTD